MFNVIGIVPARKGSKGVKQKNIREIAGKRLVEYTFCEIKKSKLIDEFIVSSDSEFINQIGEKYGAICNGIRPEFLSNDKALTIEVIKYELEKIGSQINRYSHVMLLQPTCPLRRAKHIDECITKLKEENANSLISVVEAQAYHPLRMKRIHNDRLFNYVDTGYEDMRPRQELPKVYIRNGAIYLAKIEDVFELSTLSNPECVPYIMNVEDSINIDSEIDFLLAEFHIKNKFKMDQ